ncbi:hypothetical protein AK812_SmicGene591 [Symbiodinium microadriaticum]|uniref:Uncharacterized protein n=1 Tax=Symbiodinium microadriaticum TaxID=2951 RepID=A0A1Q9F638_SYMMI|nr:hypothetical protein AK812_SmicGene591 [Symbiodinium microadriaticum]
MDVMDVIDLSMQDADDACDDAMDLAMDDQGPPSRHGLATKASWVPTGFSLAIPHCPLHQQAFVTARVGSLLPEQVPRSLDSFLRVQTSEWYRLVSAIGDVSKRVLVPRKFAPREREQVLLASFPKTELEMCLCAAVLVVLVVAVRVVVLVARSRALAALTAALRHVPGPEASEFLLTLLLDPFALHLGRAPGFEALRTAL